MSTEQEQEVEKIVRQFSAEFWRRLTWQAGQMVPGADGDLPLDIWHDNILERAMEAQEWLQMARYGAGLIDADPVEIYDICQRLAEWLFTIPGASAYSIPGEWAETPMGALWWAALVRAEGDELVTIVEAARLAGVSQQAITARIDRGSLRAFVDPASPGARQGRRLVRRSDVLPPAE